MDSKIFADFVPELPLIISFMRDGTGRKLFLHGSKNDYKGSRYVLSTNRQNIFPVLEFMAGSANLMPELANVLREAVNALKKTGGDESLIEGLEYTYSKINDLFIAHQILTTVENNNDEF